jgi:hypothetical protein
LDQYAGLKTVVAISEGDELIIGSAEQDDCVFARRHIARRRVEKARMMLR